MNKNFSDWYRAVALVPENQQLQSRWQGIEKYCKNKIKCQDIIDLIRIFFKLPTNEDFRNNFIDQFYKTDNAFPQKNNDMELSVLAGATLINIVENNVNGLDNIVLLAIKSASFKRTPTVSEILTMLNILFDDASLAIRKINIIDAPSIAPPSFKTLDDLLKPIEATNAWSPPKDIAATLSNYLKTANKSFVEMISGLNGLLLSQKIYREDSQILWWVFSEFSKDINKPLREMKLTEAAVIIGKELADIIEVLPGPYSAEAVLHKMLNVVSDNKKDVTLSIAINETDNIWRTKTVEKYKAEKTKEITPILNALYESLRVDKAEDWFAVFKKLIGIDANNIQISAPKLSYQVYLECLLLRAYKNWEDENA